MCRKVEQVIGEGMEGSLAMPVNKALAALFVEAPNGIEPLTAVLQAASFPLRYSALTMFHGWRR